MQRRAWVPSQGPLGTGDPKGLGVLQDGQRRRGSYVSSGILNKTVGKMPTREGWVGYRLDIPCLGS